MIFGGFYLDDVRGRVQFPVINDPSDADIDAAVSAYSSRRGYLGLGIKPAPEVGPYELVVYSEDGNFFLMLNSYLSDGDHHVRTLARMNNGGGEVDILGDYWQRDYVTRDVGVVRDCFKDFLRRKNVFLSIFEAE